VSLRTHITSDAVLDDTTRFVIGSYEHHGGNSALVARLYLRRRDRAAGCWSRSTTGRFPA